MNKNIGKIVAFFIICLLGLGKYVLDNNNQNNKRNKEIQQVINQNENKKNSTSKNKKSNKNNKKSKQSTTQNEIKNNTSKEESNINSHNNKYKIDYEHVIGGDENSSGKVTGGHTLLMGDVRIIKQIGSKDSNGVYRANVEIKKKNGSWQKKTSNGGINTMFPEDWDKDRVIDEINSAWENRKDYNGKDSNMWQGRSKSGVLIRGFKKPRTTAYPIYEGGR